MLFTLLVISFKEALCVPLSDFTDAFSTPKTYQSQNMADVGLRFVSDSGVCETTPGVHQMSGYITVGQNMSMVIFSAKIDMIQLFMVCLSSGFGSLNPGIRLKMHHSLYGELLYPTEPEKGVKYPRGWMVVLVVRLWSVYSKVFLSRHISEHTDVELLLRERALHGSIRCQNHID